MIKKQRTFIFFGRSGSGKGTQLNLLRKYIKENDENSEHFSYSTGEGFRNLFKSSSYASDLAKNITNSGALQPLFLSVSLWGNAFLYDLKENSHIFIDGYPRREDEAKILEDALTFLNREEVIILDFIVSRETSRNRMLKRGREDDTEENTKIRLDWYEKDVIPAVNYLKNKDGYIYIEIDAEKSIEEIFEDIISKINLYIK